MSDIQLYNQLSLLPEKLKKEVQHFVEFLLYKQKQDNPIKKRQFGCAKGKIVMLEGFDEPLDDFKEYM